MSTPNASGGLEPKPHSADVEFGAIPNARVEHHERLDSDLSDANECNKAGALDGEIPPGASIVCRKAQWRRLRSRLWHRRWMRQYFREEGVLVREKDLRKIGNEELYLDLIIVANIAVIGHDLQTTFTGWRQVETFILLFGAVYTSWRNVAFLWNMFGTKGDLLDKVGVYASHAAMSGIGLGAHGAFKTTRKQVAVSAFLASAIPISSHLVFAIMEPESRNEHNLFDQAIGSQLVAFLGIIPYFVAAFLTRESIVRALYWIPLAWTFFALPVYAISYRALHTNRPKARRVAINIEALVDKYGVLTLIVLGESLLALLFQGAELVPNPAASIGKMYAATAASVLIVYSVQTVYFNIDQNLAKGSIHALRHNGRMGLLWSQLHIPYHMALAGFMPTGLALFINAIALGEGSIKHDSGTSVRALAATAAPATFSTASRALFSAGWGLSLLISSIMALTHKAGPRERSKVARVCCRVIVVLGLAIGIPFANISPSAQLTIFAVVSGAIAIAEFILLEADRIGMITGGPIPSTAPSSLATSDHAASDIDDDDMSSEMSPDDDEEDVKLPDVLDLDRDGAHELAAERQARREAKRRQRRHGRKFEAICHAHICKKDASHEQS